MWKLLIISLGKKNTPNANCLGKLLFQTTNLQGLELVVMNMIEDNILRMGHLSHLSRAQLTTQRIKLPLVTLTSHISAY